MRETELRADRLVLPLFVSETATTREPIDAMPGVERLPLGDVRRARRVRRPRSGWERCCCSAFPPRRTPKARAPGTSEGVVQRAVAAIKRELPQLLVITDVCLCEYTTHGHCGVLGEQGRGRERRDGGADRANRGKSCFRRC